jgi:hypothetical protein
MGRVLFIYIHWLLLCPCRRCTNMIAGHVLQHDCHGCLTRISHIRRCHKKESLHRIRSQVLKTNRSMSPPPTSRKDHLLSSPSTSPQDHLQSPSSTSPPSSPSTSPQDHLQSPPSTSPQDHLPSPSLTLPEDHQPSPRPTLRRRFFFFPFVQIIMELCLIYNNLQKEFTDVQWTLFNLKSICTVLPDVQWTLFCSSANNKLLPALDLLLQTR